MLYYLFKWFNEAGIKFPGSGLFQFISFRVMVAVILSLFITTVYGKRMINLLKRKQVGETVRDLGLQGESSKKGTPTMGGLIILAGILIPTLLLANVSKVYVWLMVLCTTWLGVVGFTDDYFKIRAKRRAEKKGIKYKKSDSDGLSGKFKIIAQVILGLIIGSTLYFNDNVVVKREIQTNKAQQGAFVPQRGEHKVGEDSLVTFGVTHRFVTVKTPITTIPFIKSHEFNYAKLLPASLERFTYILYILIVIFIVTAVSNGANLTDGLDGLLAGTTAVIGMGLGIFVFVSGNIIMADYLNIMYIPDLGELSIFVGAFVGACVGFLWYNAYPAQVFMGDTGSLALGGIIASLAIIVRKELLIPILCFVFLVENVSVIMQVTYFKYTKKKYGEGRRIFLMTPIHHHYQKLGYKESKIAVRFWIVTVLSVVMALVTLKLR